MEGRPAPAIVTKYSRVYRRMRIAAQGPVGMSHKNRFFYDFPLLSGAIAQGKSDPQKRTPEIGSVICVLYDPNNPKRNMPYPAGLVKLAHQD
jgi:hypothetical protein